MYFDDFSIINLINAITCDEGIECYSTRIELFYFDDIFRRIAQWALRGEPTESIDGYYHRNKTIKFWSNGITCLFRKYMVYPLKDTFTVENGLLFV